MSLWNLPALDFSSGSATGHVGSISKSMLSEIFSFFFNNMWGVGNPSSKKIPFCSRLACVVTGQLAHFSFFFGCIYKHSSSVVTMVSNPHRAPGAYHL
jgi:hypothetical protein